MNVGGMYWETQLNAPVFIFNQSALVDGPIDIMMASMDDPSRMFVLWGNYDLGITVVLENASIEFDETQIKSSAKIVSDNALMPALFDIARTNELFDDKSLIGRVAKHYDAVFRLNDIEAGILSGRFNLDVDVQKNYFLDQTAPPMPYFAVNGYTISGEVKIAFASDGRNAQWIEAQRVNELITSVYGVQFLIGQKYIGYNYFVDFTGTPVIYKVIDKEVRANSNIITATISFESYAPPVLE
jgi:hypothetical protein